MVTLGTDAHKRSHTIVAADEQGRQVGQVTVKATPEGHLRGLRWAGQWAQRRWAIEDCRHLSRQLERDLLAAGEPVVRVPPKLMAGARRGARTRGKSDPIDALVTYVYTDSVRSQMQRTARSPNCVLLRLGDGSRAAQGAVEPSGEVLRDRVGVLDQALVGDPHRLAVVVLGVRCRRPGVAALDQPQGHQPRQAGDGDAEVHEAR
jgi:hypothetical protein